MPDALPACDWPLDDAGYASVLDVVRSDLGCLPPAGWRGFIVSARIVDKHGHDLDGDADPKGLGGCDHRDTPEWQDEHAGDGRTQTMPKQDRTPTPDPDEAPPAVHDPLVNPPAIPGTSAPATVATVGVDQAIAQVKSLAPQGAGPGLLIGGAALLAIVGAAIKFGPSFLKSRVEAAERQHELELKKLDLQERQGDERDQKCSSRYSELSLKVSILEGRVAETDTKATRAEEAAKGAASRPVFDSDTFEERLEALSKRLTKLETALKKKGGKS